MNTKPIGQTLLALAILASPLLLTAQQPKPEAKPITLSAEGSATVLELNRQVQELQLKIDNLKLQQQLVFARERVPENYPVWRVDPANGRVVLFPPEPPKPESAKTTPK